MEREQDDGPVCCIWTAVVDGPKDLESCMAGCYPSCVAVHHPRRRHQNILQWHKMNNLFCCFTPQLTVTTLLSSMSAPTTPASTSAPATPWSPTPSSGARWEIWRKIAGSSSAYCWRWWKICVRVKRHGRWIIEVSRPPVLIFLHRCSVYNAATILGDVRTITSPSSVST